MNNHVKQFFCGLIIAPILACTPTPSPDQAAPPAGTFKTSYIAGSRDAAGRFIGGTEFRTLATHQGKLYAGRAFGKIGRVLRDRKALRFLCSTDHADNGALTRLSMKG
jgi:hypothetical protein